MSTSPALYLVKYLISLHHSFTVTYNDDMSHVMSLEVQVLDTIIVIVDKPITAEEEKAGNGINTSLAR